MPNDEDQGLGLEMLRTAALISRSHDLADHIQSEGRLPRLGDERQPWSFRGWLLPYIVATSERWAWHLASFLNMRPSGPIPALHLGEPTDGEAWSTVRALADRLGERVGWERGPTLAIEWLAWALGVADEPPKGPREDCNEDTYRSFNAGHLVQRPADYLGRLLSEARGNRRDPTGFYPTPQSVATTMAEMSMVGHEGGKGIFTTVNDPCVGTGRMLLAASGQSVCLSGQDINWTCVLATKVNGALYAPWLAFGPPCPPRNSPTRGMVDECSEVTGLGLPDSTFDEKGQGFLFTTPAPSAPKEQP